MHKCMSCLENFPRRQICPCHTCKGWYCSDCQSDHTPCNEDSTENLMNDEIVDDDCIEEEVDDSKPGIWIVQMPKATQPPFNIWNYVKNAADVKTMLPSYNW